MKKALVVLLSVVLAEGAFARGWGYRPHPGPHPVHHHHHHGHGPRGWEIAAGVIGAGIVGAALYNAIEPRTVQVVQPAPVVVQPAPVVVQQPAPVVVQQPAVQNVWVDGRYVDQVQANGTVVRTWQPGHFEQR